MASLLFPVLTVTLLSILLIVTIMLLFKKNRVDFEALKPKFDSIEKSDERIEYSVKSEIAFFRAELSKDMRLTREELSNTVASFGQIQSTLLTNANETLYNQMSRMANSQAEQLKSFEEKLVLVRQSNETKIGELKESVERKLQEIQIGNEAKLDEMRITVDEKLQGTLEKRLTESFKLVSERLEQVSKGLGEMQTVATGVGDLKKILTNVKMRGTWGEVQLGMMLEQALAPDQYATNVATTDTMERVEYAIKLPGRGDATDSFVYLPIDAKFPVEDYMRIIDSREKADSIASDAAVRSLAIEIERCAKDIHAKYVSPPKTTDFGILYLPVEGLFAEVISNCTLVEKIQSNYQIMIAGPTTLWAILNSLLMGFRTLAIQKRSGEVWKLLGAIKTEWSKYDKTLELVQKKLSEASGTIDKVHVRTRAIDKHLRKVEELSSCETNALLGEIKEDLFDEQIEQQENVGL